MDLFFFFSFFKHELENKKDIRSFTTELANGGYSSKVRAQKGGGHRKARETLSA